MNVRSLVLIIGVSVLALACGASTNPTSMTATATPVPATQPAVSERAPDLVLATLDGRFRLSDQTGKVTVLYFSFPG